MKKLLAKMKVGSVVNFGNQNIEANLTAVTGTSEENKTFSMYTPRADLKIHITNPDALDFFEAGEEYVITFQKAQNKHNTQFIVDKVRLEGLVVSGNRDTSHTRI